MSWYEDYVQKYLHCYGKIKGEPVYIRQIRHKNRLDTHPSSENTAQVEVVYKGGKRETLSLSESKLEYVFPPNTNINGEIGAYWYFRRPERQYNRAVSNGNVCFYFVGDLVFDSAISFLKRKHIPFSFIPVEDISTLGYKVFTPNLVGYDEAVAKIASGEKLTCAFSKYFSVGLSHNDSFLLYRKTQPIGEIDPNNIRKVKLLYKEITQEVEDLSKRNSLNLEIL